MPGASSSAQATRRGRRRMAASSAPGAGPLSRGPPPHELLDSAGKLVATRIPRRDGPRPCMTNHPDRPLGAVIAERRPRVESIDVVRGAVMVLMALDHVRVFSGVPAGGPTAAVFLTRWVTHFCAPAFFLFAGTSAYLRGSPAGGPSLTRWLWTRGLVLVALEMTVIRLSWTFNLDYAHYMLAGVIWSLGWSMVLLSVIVRLPQPVLTGLAALMIAGHNLIPALLRGQTATALATPFGPLLRVLYFGGAFPLGGRGEPNFFVLYSLVPWVGVMSAGYALGHVMARPPQVRRRWCAIAGAVAVLAFLVLRGLQLYGDRPWTTPPGEQPWAPAWIRFLATTKYPASLQFLLMTLGPTLLALAALEGVHSRLTRSLAVFGRVPMFYYLLHIPTIHVIALAVAALRTPAALPWLFANHPMNPPEPPAGYTWPLPLLYAVTLLVVCALYLPCAWYARVRGERRWGWTAYV